MRSVSNEYTEELNEDQLNNAKQYDLENLTVVHKIDSNVAPFGLEFKQYSKTTQFLIRAGVMFTSFLMFGYVQVHLYSIENQPRNVSVVS